MNSTIETPAEVLREAGDRLRDQGEILRHAAAKAVWTPEKGHTIHHCLSDMVRTIMEEAGWLTEHSPWPDEQKIPGQRVAVTWWALTAAVAETCGERQPPLPSPYIPLRYNFADHYIHQCIRYNDERCHSIGDLCAVCEKGAAKADELV